MSFTLGKRSKDNLFGVHPQLREVVQKAIQLTEQDFTVIQGLRTLEQQQEYVANGASLTMNSKHLAQKDGYSHAVDIYPYFVSPKHPHGSVHVDAKQAQESNKVFIKRFHEIAYAMLTAAKELGVTITWGADWDRDGDLTDHKFVDMPHFQIEV